MVKSYFLYFVIINAALVAGCSIIARNSGIEEVSPRFYFSYTDNPKEQRIDLNLVSRDMRKLCLSSYSWPGKTGQLDSGSQMAFLKTDLGIFSAKDTNAGSCPSGCGYILIEPAAILTGYIPYSQFGDATAISLSSIKELTHEIDMNVCKK